MRGTINHADQQSMPGRKDKVRRKHNKVKTNQSSTACPDDHDRSHEALHTSEDAEIAKVGAEPGLLPPKGYWINTDNVNRTNAATVQNHVKQFFYEQRDFEKLCNHAPVGLCKCEADFRDVAEFMVQVAEKTLAQTPTHDVGGVHAEGYRACGRLMAWQEELDAMLCFLQVFNVNKGTELAADQFFHISQMRVERLKKKIKSIDVLFNDASPGLLDASTLPASCGDKDQGSQMSTTQLTLALEAFQKNCEVTVQTLRSIRESFDEEPISLPCVPPEDLNFRSFQLPQGLPQHIRTEFDDLEYVRYETSTLRTRTGEGSIFDLLSQLREAILTGLICNDETWNYCKRNAACNSLVSGRYERARSWHLTCGILWNRCELKIRRYLRDNGLEGKLSTGLSKWLNMDKSDEDLVDDWEKNIATIKFYFNSFSEMIEECEEARRTPGRVRMLDSMQNTAGRMVRQNPSKMSR